VRSSVIAVVPARGGSRGIPRKNVRLLCGKPLIAYSIQAALSSGLIDRVVVSTEDEEIAEVSRIYGADVVERPPELARDDVTLDPVIFHAVEAIEEREHRRYELVVTIQPTSPLLGKRTVDEAINVMLGSNYDTLISVTAEPHICWMVGTDKAPVPLQKERKNRQQLEPIFRETGALLICRRDVMSKQSRIGRSVYLFEIPQEEAGDIDDYADWWVAENLLKRLNIVFRVDGSETIGLGHIYRALTLANRISNHKVSFLTDESKKLGLGKLREYNHPVFTFRDEGEFSRVLEELKPDIIVNDILDTNREYMQDLRSRGFFLVNFEDLGEGSELANVVVNAIYEHSSPPENHYYGYKYECLRDEFYIFPRAKVKERVENILITFGGVDENNLTLGTLHAIEKAGLEDVDVTVVLGLGYPFRDKLRPYVDGLTKRGFNIELKQNVGIMAKHMADADLVVTSNGRTLYEVASLGTPCISISQNEREMRHLFSQICKGIMNLGMASNVSEDAIASALSRVIGDYHLRREMSENMLKFDLRKGIDRTLRLIFDKYWEWKENGVEQQAG
jgi:CMP-N-acetylneuraminic acid synthetase/spore coat polysaccharide biosynthesis predicted glycosyltransferase SpsG